LLPAVPVLGTVCFLTEVTQKQCRQRLLYWVKCLYSDNVLLQTLAMLLIW